MRKSISILSITLLMASLIIPSARGYADDDDRRGDRSEREDLRQDRQQLEQLRKRRQHEIREGDRHETREYNDKIHDLQKDMHRDRRALRDRRHDRDHDHD
jgi:hypothetical protein